MGRWEGWWRMSDGEMMRRIVDWRLSEGEMGG